MVYTTFSHNSVLYRGSGTVIVIYKLNKTDHVQPGKVSVSLSSVQKPWLQASPERQKLWRIPD